jgi:hypothetical protein
MIYTALYIMFWMGADPLRGQSNQFCSGLPDGKFGRSEAHSTLLASLAELLDGPDKGVRHIR